MKKENKEKKAKKTLSAKESWLKIGKGLLSNQACFEAGRMPVYWAILIFVVSIVMTWIPVLSKGYTADNSALFNSAGNAEVDKGVKAFLEQDYTKEFVVKADGKYLDIKDALSKKPTDEYTADNVTKKIKGENTNLLKGNYNDDGSKTDSYVKKDNITNLSFDYYFDSFATKKSSQIDNPDSSTSTSTSTSTNNGQSYDYDNSGMNVYLMTYYFPELSYDEQNFNKYFQNFVYNVVFNLNAEGKMQNYPHTFMVLTKDTIVVYLFNLTSYKNMNITASFVGKLSEAFKNVTADTGFVSFIKKGDDKLSVNETYKNFCAVMNDAVRDSAISKVWNNVLTLTIIDVVVVLLAAVVLLIMHKRKSSIMRDVNFINTFNESCAFFVTPAILGMAFGFMNSSYGYMIIIAGVLMRIVFGSSRLMPPVGSEQDKPLYQARS